MIIDTDKMRDLVMGHIRLCVACGLWITSWFSARQCTNLPSPASAVALVPAIEFFWFVTSVFLFVLAALVTLRVVSDIFGCGILK